MIPKPKMRFDPLPFKELRRKLRGETEERKIEKKPLSKLESLKENYKKIEKRLKKLKKITELIVQSTKEKDRYELYLLLKKIIDTINDNEDYKKKDLNKVLSILDGAINELDKILKDIIE